MLIYVYRCKLRNSYYNFKRNIIHLAVAGKIVTSATLLLTMAAMDDAE